MQTLRPSRKCDASIVFLHDKHSLVLSVMVEHISIANCFGSLFNKKKFENLNKNHSPIIFPRPPAAMPAPDR
jgi:hypothetical protein